MTNTSVEKEQGHLAVVTSRLEGTNTFLASDLAALGEQLRVTLWTLYPEPGPTPMPADGCRTLPGALLSATRSIARLVYQNVGAFLEAPGRYLVVLWSVVDLHLASPRNLLRNLLLFPFMVVCARGMAREGVTHVHGYWATYAATAARAISELLSIPYSMSVHSHDVLEEPRALRLKIEGAKLVIACSEFIKSRSLVRSGAGPEAQRKTVVCHHGVDGRWFQEGARRRQVLGRSVDILSVGRIVPKKGFITLVQALQILPTDMTVDCVICGPVISRPYYRRLGIELNQLRNGVWVQFTGWQSQDALRRRMKMAAVYVQPAEIDGPDGDCDGIPNALLEAMASGVPVVASAAGGIPEVVLDRWNGLLVPPGDFRRMAQAIVEVMADSDAASERAQNARAFVAQGFGIDATAPRLCTAFRPHRGLSVPEPDDWVQRKGVRLKSLVTHIRLDPR